jgi:hypothetical protein
MAAAGWLPASEGGGGGSRRAVGSLSSLMEGQGAFPSHTSLFYPLFFPSMRFTPSPLLPVLQVPSLAVPKL